MDYVLPEKSYIAVTVQMFHKITFRQQKSLVIFWFVGSKISSGNMSLLCRSLFRFLSVQVPVFFGCLRPSLDITKKRSGFIYSPYTLR